MSVVTPKIIVVSLNPCVDRGIEVPNFAIGAHQTGSQLFRRPAGKPVNLAHTLGILKVPTLIIGFIGKGQQEYFERYLNRESVGCQLFPVAGKTRENITIFDPVLKTETHIRDRGFEVAVDEIGRLRKKLAILCRKDTTVVFNGSLPPGLSLEDLLELVQICHLNEAKVCIDCAGSVLRACRPLGVWMIKPNQSELAEMLEHPVQTPQQILAAGKELQKNIAVTVVTAGKDGAFLFSESDNLKARIPLDPKLVKNTVGCGDAMLAGFLAGAAQGKDLKTSFLQALAVATSAATSITPGDISLPDVEKFTALAEIASV
jgi:1-phosphofructokinase family hexose kinase